MSGRVIKCNLSQKSIGNAIKELKAYQNSLRDKNELFLKRLCELGIPVIDENIMLVQGDSDKNHNTYIKINRFGNYAQATLVCEGSGLLFIEFGAGIHYNGAAGSIPHPKEKNLVTQSVLTDKAKEKTNRGYMSLILASGYVLTVRRLPCQSIKRA